jgi:hypothetical protein
MDVVYNLKNQLGRGAMGIVEGVFVNFCGF